jgi:CRISPR/Cas system CSM-associated protein Csm2 small subunit
MKQKNTAGKSETTFKEETKSNQEVRICMQERIQVDQTESNPTMKSNETKNTKAKKLLLHTRNREKERNAESILKNITKGKISLKTIQKTLGSTGTPAAQTHQTLATNFE